MDITYNTLVESFRNKLINCCDNILRFESIDAPFKEGYYFDVATPHSYTPPVYGGRIKYIPYSRCQIDDNIVYQASVEDFNTMFNYFVEATGVNLTDICTINGMYYLLENLVRFESGNMCFSTSIYSNNKWIVYKNPEYKDSNNNTLTSKADIVNAMKNQVIQTVHQSDINDNYVRKNLLFESLERYSTSIKQNLRGVPVKYVYSCLN